MSQVANGPGGMSPVREDKYKPTVPIKVLGCIPQSIHGDCGCICRPLSCVKYWINPTVMVLAIIIIWSFVIWCAVDTEHASVAMGDAQQWVVGYFGWFYIASLIIFGGFSVYLCFSRFGDIKLGPPDEPPKYSLMTWFSMLFSAGIGIGLYFFGVAEPVWHFADMQSGSSRWYHLTTNQQAMESINVAWFHWGFTASATYCAAGLPLAYHHHVKGEPLRESVCFMALLGEKYANGIIGCLIDLSSIVGTMFGIATSLGLGVLSINAGLKFVFGVEESLAVQMAIIWVITLFATISVLTGLDHGIRRLSEVNFMFSFIVLFFMFFALDPFYLINLFLQGIGYHFQWILELTFNTQAFEQAGFYDDTESTESQVTWMSSWTVFYWAWWIAWAPFVGIFIAQISRGRTVREFIIGNMIVPTLLTCIWLTVFGGIGLYNELGSIQNDVQCDPREDGSGTVEDWLSEFDGHKIVKLTCYGSAQDMLFATYNTLPLPTTISIISMIGILTYFVTSSDSASHVIDVLTAGGHTEPPKLQRIFWAVSEGAVASVLLATSGGGTDSLQALQTASLVAALPFCVVLLFEVMATYKTLMIHMGEIVPSEMVYWRYDLFECGQKWPNILLGAICPPYLQTKTRLNICENNYESERNDRHFESNAFKYFWIIGYWLLWFLVILFLLLDYAISGMFELALSFYLLYLICCVVNRGNIKLYYEIDSSNVLFDVLSWVFCWCCAAVQEEFQSKENLELSSVQLKVNQSVEMQNKSMKSKEEEENDDDDDDDHHAEDAAFMRG
eukprot:543104_1